MLAHFCNTALVVRSFALYCISLFSADFKKQFIMTNKNRVPFCCVPFCQMFFWYGCFCEVLFCWRDFVHMFVSSHGRTNNAFFVMQFWCFVSLAWLLYEVLSILIFFIFSLNLIRSFVDIPNLDIWQYVLVMSRKRFRVNPHSIVAWMSKNSLLEAVAKSEV